MKLTQIYCDVDDFCLTFIPEWQKQQLTQGEKKRNRAPRMGYSKMLCILVSAIGLPDFQVVLSKAGTGILAVSIS